MKIRQAFVSNSSSSSFIVIGHKPDFSRSVLLSKEQAKKVIEYIENDEYFKKKGRKVEWNGEDSVYLTEFLSDAGNRYDKALEAKGSYRYHEGGHNGPYWEDNFDALLPEGDFGWNGVWIRKEHNDDGYFPCPHCGGAIRRDHEN